MFVRTWILKQILLFIHESFDWISRSSSKFKNTYQVLRAGLITRASTDAVEALVIKSVEALVITKSKMDIPKEKEGS